jgi:hypothetical protein
MLYTLDGDFSLIHNSPVDIEQVRLCSKGNEFLVFSEKNGYNEIKINTLRQTNSSILSKYQKAWIQLVAQKIVMKWQSLLMAGKHQMISTHGTLYQAS